MLEESNRVLNEQLEKISLQYAIDNKFFGPIYHGTSDGNRDLINKDGFKVFYGDARSGNVQNGYEISNYSGGIPAPVHHLGFGIYFTTNKSIAKKYNGGSESKLSTYFAMVPKLEIINLGAPNTMMKWWLQNGYNYDVKSKEKIFGNPETNLAAIKAERYRATIALTDTLKLKYDVVWYKGKGLCRLLDGDQVCIYDPKNIFTIDMSLSKPMDIGSKVITINDLLGYDNKTIEVPKNTKGIIMNKRPVDSRMTWAEGSDFIYEIKFEKGGRKMNVVRKDIEPYIKK